MFLFDWFPSFQPLQNPLGFGVSDFLELALLILLGLGVVGFHPRLARWIAGFAKRTHWCLAVLFAAPIVLRLALLAHHPVPVPDVYDEFSHLLVADTLRHFRLANPPHPMSRFFETFFVLQQPAYSSIYPLGQGLLLAFGWTVLGLPWAGVLLATGAFCALCYWMLLGWTTPGWSLLGGGLAVIAFGPLCPWMNDYWGGSLAAAAGCLVFGALPRLRESRRVRDAVLLGTGLAIHFLTRPFESIFLGLSVALFFLPELRARQQWPRLAKWAGIAALVLIPAIGLTLLQNKQVTGSWTTLPYQLSQYQYGRARLAHFPNEPGSASRLVPEQELEYRSQRAFRRGDSENAASFFARLEYRVRYYRFFLLPPLYLALLVFLLTIRQYGFLWVFLTLALFALGVNFFPNLQVHYLAAVTCLFILIAVTGLQRLSSFSAEASRLLIVLCLAQFVFWYGLHLYENAEFSPVLRSYETWNMINHGNPERRIAIDGQLARIPGKVLVFVHYDWPRHNFQDEWIYNRADIDGARVVWARDRGDAENQLLRRYYPDRTAMLLEPDDRPPKLGIYETKPPVPEPVAAPPTPEPPAKKLPPPGSNKSPFEEVPPAK